MSKATRRKFLKAFGLGLLGTGAALAAWPRLSLSPSARSAAARRTLSIRPLDPGRCAPSFLRYCARARFATAAEALEASRRTRYPFTIHQAHAS